MERIPSRTGAVRLQIPALDAGLGGIVGAAASGVGVGDIGDGVGNAGVAVGVAVFGVGAGDVGDGVGDDGGAVGAAASGVGVGDVGDGVPCADADAVTGEARSSDCKAPGSPAQPTAANATMTSKPVKSRKRNVPSREDVIAPFPPPARNSSASA